jgi:transposase InsO family protein
MLIYEQLKNVHLVSRHFGISAKTFYKWRKRYLASNRNPQSLVDRSRRPKHSPSITKEQVTKIIKSMRNKTKFGPDRIKFYLAKDYSIVIPRSTIYAILKREGLIHKAKKRKRRPLIYNLPTPGDNVQIDIKLIGGYSVKRAVQYSAVDDATRLKFTRISPERANHYSVEFLNYITGRFPFKIKRISTDNDSVFTNCYTGDPRTHPLKMPRLHPFSLKCQELKIKHKLNRPACPQQNGKVERSHRTDEEEFYRIHKTYNTIEYLAKERKKYDELFNNHRPHMGLKGLTPLQKLKSYDKYRGVTYVYS